MNQLRQTVGVSFRDLELSVFKKLQEMFTRVLKEILEELDELVLGTRDKGRYEVKDKRERTLQTLAGDVTFTRRYYLDKKKGTYVALLDQALQLEKSDQMSPGLAMAAVMQAVLGPSYRGASESLSRLYGHQVASQETIRQLLLRVGRQIEQEERQRRRQPEGKRKVPVLFIEADGLWASMQQEERQKREVKLMVAHEGWQRKTPGSPEYELMNKSHYFNIDQGDFWEGASRQLLSGYDIDEDTVVVINGDRADWIRRGVDYFPKALYQVDRYHLKRDLRRWLRGRDELEEALDAVDDSDYNALIGVLATARRKLEPQTRKKMNALLADLHRIPEAFMDYRVRLKEMGHSVGGMRGMGAAESNVDRFSNRLKKRGQSWSTLGLKAMVHSLVKRFEGRLEHYAKHISKVHNLLNEEHLQRGAGQLVRQVLADATTVKQASSLMRGTTRSGGMSKLFRRLNEARLPGS